METGGAHTFPKAEKLCGKTTIASLMEGGRWGSSAHLRYCWKLHKPVQRSADQTETEQEQAPTEPAPQIPNRIVISVPKKFFKRAVKRNLLKRRTREAYRLHKELLPGNTLDLLFIWSSAEVGDFATIEQEVTAILQRITSKL